MKKKQAAEEIKEKIDEAKKKSEEKPVDDKDKKIEELTDTLQRLQAEFENYKKRIDKEKQEFLKYANAGLICKLLPVLDSFEMALKNTIDKEKFVKGIELIYSQFYQLLEDEGLRPIETAGKMCDPYLHEVLLTEECDKEDDCILEQLQKGYMLGSKVLRHSKVKVAKKSAEKKAKCQ